MEKKTYGIRDLAKWKGVYDFNCQIYNGDFNIYVSRDDVDLTEAGGYDNFSDAVEVIMEWINRVNKIKQI